jgi:nucleoside-diphosphate-sugar epimerase
MQILHILNSLKLLNFLSRLLPEYPTMKWWVDAANALRSTKLQYTLVITGFIMDYYGIPHVKSNMHSFRWILDFDNQRAVIPGDGKTKISFLFSKDVAKYVTGLLELDSWPELSRFEGDTLTPHEMVEIAERVTGKHFHQGHLVKMIAN